jgi:hypothetical protein
MPASPDQTEGLKLIGEWCKWLVTVETAAIGVIGTFLLKENPAITTCAKLGCRTAVISFVCSIIVAGGIFSAIPISVQDMKTENEKILDRRIYLFGKGVLPLYVANHLLFGLFVLGIAAFAMVVVFR